jgi:hypothetical protein
MRRVGRLLLATSFGLSGNGWCGLPALQKLVGPRARSSPSPRRYVEKLKTDPALACGCRRLLRIRQLEADDHLRAFPRLLAIVPRKQPSQNNRL